MVGDFRGHLLSLRDPSHPLSSFTQLLDNPHLFNPLCSAWNPCQFPYIILQNCLSKASSLLTTGKHICCSLCFYLELGIWKESARTHGQAFVCILVWACGCEHACACARTCACMQPHGCGFTCVHGHMSFWMTAWARGWVCVWSTYTHTCEQTKVPTTMCFSVCGVVGCIPCASGFVCMFAHMWFCVSVCIWCEFASPYAPGGTEASANYKKQRNNLHNLAFDLCHPHPPLLSLSCQAVSPALRAPSLSFVF